MLRMGYKQGDSESKGVKRHGNYNSVAEEEVQSK